MLQPKEFFDKVEDQWCYLFNLWCVKPPLLFQSFMLFYERELIKEASTDQEKIMFWRLRTSTQIEDELPKMIVKFISTGEYR